MKAFMSLLCLLLAFEASADFLIVQRNGNMRAEANTESEILEKIHTGDSLILLEPSKTNSYWHVRGRASGQEGWVYQTLVKKVEGSLEEFAEPGSVVDIRILDVGAGHCALIKLPGDKYVIYDAGGSDNLQGGNTTLGQIKEYIPVGSTIELLVLSHTDADHINAAEQVVRDYAVKKVLWTGFEKSMIVGGTSTASYRRLKNMLAATPSTININLNAEDSTLVPGSGFQVGATKFTFLCGFGKPPIDWDDFSLSDAEQLNGVSIVMKLSFAGNSVLFTGDAVGRHITSDEDVILATEGYMVQNAAQFLPSTILIAPHHGAANGSSVDFVNHVQPKVVIFPAGHDHRHPTKRTAELYLQTVPQDSIFRTDRGDDEQSSIEWALGKKPGCRDLPKDDNIQIQLRGNGSYRVYYMTPNGPCGAN